MLMGKPSKKPQICWASPEFVARVNQVVKNFRNTISHPMSNPDRNQSSANNKFESLGSANEALQELLRQGSVEESKIEGQPVRLFAEALEACKADLDATRRCEILQRYARNNGEEDLPPELMVRTCGGRLEQEQACLVPILCKRQIKDFERFQEIVASKNLRGDNPKVEAVQRRLVGNIVGCITRWDHEFALNGLINTVLRCSNEMAAMKECETLARLSKEGWSSTEVVCSKQIESEKDCVFRHFCRNTSPTTLPNPSSPSSPSPPSILPGSSSTTSTPRDACYQAFLNKEWLIGTPRKPPPSLPFSPSYPSNSNS